MSTDVGDGIPGLPSGRNQPAVPAPDEDFVADSEIEAILAREADSLPPEPHVPGRPFSLLMSEVGRGGIGRVGIWVILAFLAAEFIHKFLG